MSPSANNTKFWDKISHFTPDEFTSPDMMHPGVIKCLDGIRNRSGVAIYVTSSFREGDAKSHGLGYAVDISDNKTGKDITSAWRFAVLEALFAVKIYRIGIYDKHIHFDIWDWFSNVPSGVSWIGISS